MPELPEVETVRSGLEPWLRGRCIRQAVIRQPRLRCPLPDSFAADLRGLCIESVQRRGKYLLLDSADGGALIIHLGMSGSLRILPEAPPPQKHDHIDLILDNGHCLRYRDPRRFGSFHWCPAEPLKHPLLASLGPEPLSEDFSAEYLHNAVKNRRSAIKTVIMDSHVVVGVGNIYASESLFLAGILPTQSASQISPACCEGLTESIRQVLQAAIAQGGTTLRDFVRDDGQPGYFSQSLRVYKRAGQACLTCGTPIQHCVLGQRATYYCPQCQK